MALSTRTRTAIVLAGLLVAPAAEAQTQNGFVLDRFDPSDRGSRWFVLDSLDFQGHLQPSAGVVGSWAKNALVVYDRNGTYVSSLVDQQVFVHPGASLALWDRLRASFELPIAAYQSGTPVTIGTKTFAPPGSAFGDLRLGLDSRLFGAIGEPISGGLGVDVYVPTGSRADYTSDGTARMLAKFSLAGDIGPIGYSGRVGYHYRPLTEDFERNPLGSELVFGAAAGVNVANRKLLLGPEIFGSSITDDRSFLRRRGTPIEGLLGAHVKLSSFRVGAGAGTGLSRGWGTPALRTFLSIEWVPEVVVDTDHDGVRDHEDACPTVAGVRTDDSKTNGCPAIAYRPPPPADRDGDGIVDGLDACPDVPGVTNDDPKKNGCPADRDADGVADGVDACPDTPGPKSDDPKKNGCPPDRDGDGIPDAADACPDVAGVKTDDPLSNGCPPDRDSDGIVDTDDACPDVAGPADPDPKRNGCPLARIEGGEIKIAEQVRFKLASADLLRDSDPILLAVATTLKAHPEITKLRVEGHTDNKGSDDTNGKLSRDRAAAVVKWLTTYGIDKSRLEPVGYGAKRPVAPNDTEEGRQNNRRVEFHFSPDTSKPPAKK